MIKKNIYFFYLILHSFVTIAQNKPIIIKKHNFDVIVIQKDIKSYGERFNPNVELLTNVINYVNQNIKHKKGELFVLYFTYHQGRKVVKIERIKRKLYRHILKESTAYQKPIVYEMFYSCSIQWTKKSLIRAKIFGDDCLRYKFYTLEILSIDTFNLIE